MVETGSLFFLLYLVLVFFCQKNICKLLPLVLLLSQPVRARAHVHLHCAQRACACLCLCLCTCASAFTLRDPRQGGILSPIIFCWCLCLWIQHASAFAQQARWSFVTHYIYILHAWQLLRQPLLVLGESLVEAHTSGGRGVQWRQKWSLRVVVHITRRFHFQHI